MFLHIVKATCLGGYKLKLVFDDGVTVEVDLRNELHGEVFEPLRDLDTFRQVMVNRETHTIEWPNGADFAPEFLREIGQVMEAAASPVPLRAAALPVS
ncbi:MAG: DUF2442 domain-containing protein [Thermoflexales bacterium]|nr:DUF2442 domain-containing protein [Thermoflexales bacterium]